MKNLPILFAMFHLEAKQANELGSPIRGSFNCFCLQTVMETITSKVDKCQKQFFLTHGR